MNNYGQTPPSETPYYPILGDAQANQFPPGPQPGYYSYAPPPTGAPGMPQPYVTPMPVPVQGYVPLLPNQPHCKKGGKTRGKRVIYASFITFLLIMEIICLYLLLFKLRIVEYCYWDFSVTHSYKNTSDSLKVHDYDLEIDDFYEEACLGGDEDSKNVDNLFPECDDLCTLTKKIYKAKKFAFLFGIGAGILSIASLVLVWVKAWKKKKVSKWVVHGINLLTFLAYVIGLIVYIKNAGFTKNYNTPSKTSTGVTPKDFEALSGFAMAIFLCIYALIYKLIELCLVS